MVRDGCGQPGHRTLKLTLYQEWIDAMKTKSNFNDFWVDVVKIGCGHLVHETLKSAEWVYEWADFLHSDCDAISFGETNIVLYIFDF